MKSGNLNFLEPSGPLQACNGTAMFHVAPTCFGALTSWSDTKVSFMHTAMWLTILKDQQCYCFRCTSITLYWHISFATKTCKSQHCLYPRTYLPGCWYVLCPTRKETSYSDQTLTFASHSKTIQKVVRPTRSPWQQWPLHRTKNGDLSIVFSVGSG
jgi:hypothetical protein